MLDVRPRVDTHPLPTRIVPVGTPKHEYQPKPARVSVAVVSDDQLTGQGAIACLQAHTELQVLPTLRRREAEVVLIIVQRVTEEIVTWMRHEAGADPGRTQRFVLVGDGIQGPQMLQAVIYGLTSVIPRQGADFEQIVRTVQRARDDRPDLPEAELGWLIKQIRDMHSDVLAPRGLTVTKLETREADVLTLLAEGMDTQEIAEQLKYSERTVKNIIHTLLTRFELRNRAHAVSFALRNKLL